MVIRLYNIYYIYYSYESSINSRNFNIGNFLISKYWSFYIWSLDILTPIPILLVFKFVN